MEVENWIISLYLLVLYLVNHYIKLLKICLVFIYNFFTAMLAISLLNHESVTARLG